VLESIATNINLMKIAYKTVAIRSAILVGCGFISACAMPLKTIHITSGEVGIYSIGETKEDILSKFPNEAFSPQPKPAECPENWISVTTMSNVQKTCLLSSDTWIEGIDSVKHLCPKELDPITTLHFQQNKLDKIAIECWYPE
jgi:hypothetical protein